AIDVQRGRQGAVERLGGHVGDGAGDGGRVGEVGCDAEVGEQGLVLAAVPEDVGRLDVPVDDAERVDLAQAVGDVGDVAGGQGPGQRAGVLDPLLQRAALDVLEDQAGAVGGVMAPGVDLDDVGVVEVAQDAGVGAQGGQGLPRGGTVEELEGDAPAQG